MRIESTYFPKDELECPCCGAMPSDGFIMALNHLRDLCGFPLPLDSCKRCEKYNKKVKGAKSSQHIKNAADIKIGKLTKIQRHKLLKYCFLLFQGVGIYNAHYHIDTRKTCSTWTGKSK